MCDTEYTKSHREMMTRLYGFKSIGGHSPHCLEAAECYSREIRWAWTVVEKLKARSLSWSAHDLADMPHTHGTHSFVFDDLEQFEPMIANGVGHVTEVRHRLNTRGSSNPKEWHWPSAADTMPLAICRAALKTVAAKAKEASHGT
jgi:hypothetical protein